MASIQDKEGQACVLLVDDESATFAVLSSRGFEVSWFTEIRSLLDRIGSLADKDSGRAIIVAETRLTDRCVPDFYSQLKSAGSRIPVIALARDGDIATAVRAIRSGAADVLHKPINVAVLSQRIRGARQTRSAADTIR